MKLLRLFASVFAVSLAVYACEKPILDEDGKKDTTTVKDDKGGNGSSDNSGSTGNTGSGGDNTESGSSGTGSGTGGTGTGSGSGGGADSGKPDGGSGSGGGSGSEGSSDSQSQGNGTQNSPFNVYAFMQLYNGNIVWVQGYIVGAATGASGKNRYTFEAPYNYKTAILLADSPTETDLSKVISIQLGSGTKLRGIANLDDHPENKGRQILIYGEKTTYLKLPGVKGVQGYFTIGW